MGFEILSSRENVRYDPPKNFRKKPKNKKQIISPIY